MGKNILSVRAIKCWNRLLGKPWNFLEQGQVRHLSGMPWAYEPVWKQRWAGVFTDVSQVGVATQCGGWERPKGSNEVLENALFFKKKGSMLMVRMVKKRRALCSVKMYKILQLKGFSFPFLNIWSWNATRKSSLLGVVQRQISQKPGLTFKKVEK